MPLITLLGQNSSHGAPVVVSNQSTVTINGITVNVMGGQICTHYSHPTHPAPPLTDSIQSYVTINGLPIFTIGAGASCGARLCPRKKKTMQQFVQIS